MMPSLSNRFMRREQGASDSPTLRATSTLVARELSSSAVRIPRSKASSVAASGGDGRGGARSRASRRNFARFDDFAALTGFTSCVDFLRLIGILRKNLAQSE